jgi:uncharacterized membrane protein
MDKWVFVRVAVFMLAPLLGMLPGVEYDSLAKVITIDLEAAFIGAGAGAVAGAGVFAKWGNKEKPRRVR